MIGIDLITEDLVPLKHTDTGEMASQMMDDYKVRHLSVMKGNSFVGVVSEDDLLNQSDLSLPLTELFDHLPRPYVNGKDHIFDVLKLAAEDHLTVIPVLDDQEHFLGNIKAIDVVQTIGNIGSIGGEGSIIVLEMNDIDYSLAQISQVIEAEDAKILTSFITSNPSSKQLEVTLKINKLDVGRVISALERYNYTIKISFQKNSFDEGLKDRYEELMKYLNI